MQRNEGAFCGSYEGMNVGIEGVKGGVYEFMKSDYDNQESRMWVIGSRSVR